MLSTTIASTNRSNKGEYAAISLLDKYARISSGLESTRKQTQKMRNEIEILNNEIHKLKYNQRVELIANIEHTEKEIESFENNDIKDSKIVLQNSKVKYECLKVIKKNFESEVENKKKIIKQRRLNFIQKSNEFRYIWFKAVKSKKCRHTTSDVFTLVESDVDGAIDQDSCKKNLTYENECVVFHLEQFAVNINNRDPEALLKLVRSIQKVDFEIDEAKQNAVTAIKNESYAQLGHKNALDDLEIAYNRTQKRRKRLNLQHSQLESVRNDVAMIEEEIEKVRSFFPSMISLPSRIGYIFYSSSCLQILFFHHVSSYEF